MNQREIKPISISVTPVITMINIAVFFGAFLLYVSSLWLASHASHLGWSPILGIIVGVIVFSISGHMMFSLLHEAVHGIFSHSRFLNEIFGQLSAMTFPTGLKFQRTCHFSHHLMNRTDSEIFDMYYPTDNKVLKYFQFYSILTGLYWLSVSVGWMLYLVFPWAYRIFTLPLFQKEKSTDAVMFLPFINHPAKYRIRFELLVTLAFHWVIWNFLDLQFWPTFACFWIFGMQWGALQYADHAWSERDIRTGAWNLKAHPLVRAVFLNYTYHLVHHLHPQMPWIYLPKYVDPNSPQPSFFRIYLEMWKGPKPMNAPPPKAVSEAFRAIFREG